MLSNGHAEGNMKGDWPVSETILNPLCQIFPKYMHDKMKHCHHAYVTESSILKAIITYICFNNMPNH